ncbi:middle subunit-like [Brachionus plicatilis]|uniref:ferroxidase n=1 Tax=Brachionus plicatilis TaxID=10195 RepID=A0A3M7SEI0_BRAPC|nr:middle subunit-like [Brachionus plicatilis]
MMIKSSVVILIGILSIQQSLDAFKIRSLNSRPKLESRAIQHFGINCLLNRYLQHEFELGMEYLNASIYMRHDRVALHGFGKMFKKFWQTQVNHVEKISDYIVHRGGSLETPSYRFYNTLNQFDYFANESSIVRKFLNAEKRLNRYLLELHQATSQNRTEIYCVQKYNERLRGFYELPSENDVYSAHFLDENLVSHKVHRIKYMADLFRKIIRFDQHPGNVAGVSHNLNQIGIHLLDKELDEKF